MILNDDQGIFIFVGVCLGAWRYWKSGKGNLGEIIGGVYMEVSVT